MTECKLWVGRISPGGYGVMSIDGADVLVHRRVWELHNESVIPAGMIVMHTCDNPPCVNPLHLMLGTHADNQRDKAAKGRQARGERNGRAKLTRSMAEGIRALAARGFMRASEIARLYHVDGSTVRSILRGDTWREPFANPSPPLNDDSPENEKAPK
jgi:hypothetical protein